MAASYWIGPSTRRSGARVRTSSAAADTFSTSLPAPELPVEYESIVTAGSIPYAAAVAADQTAMSASCSAVVSGTTAQSPYTRTWFSRHMKNTDDTTETPGTVRTSWSAVRIVCA